MKLLKRIYEFIMKLFSIKVAIFIVATWALSEAMITEWTWFGCCLLLIGGREVAKIMAGNLGLKK